MIVVGYVCWSVSRMATSFDSRIDDEVPMVKPLFESTLRKVDVSFVLVIVWKDNNPHVTDDFKATSSSDLLILRALYE